MTLPDIRVLLVEDDADDVFFLKRAFEKAGVGGLDQVVSDGQEAIAYLSGTGMYADRRSFPPPSHVILDLKLPKVSGLEVLEWIRTRGPRRDLPVAILSSSGEKVDRDRAQALAIDGYFVKPSGQSELVTIVRSLATSWALPTRRPEEAGNGG
jgi:CheY-like chemotaxis protein